MINLSLFCQWIKGLMYKIGLKTCEKCSLQFPGAQPQLAMFHATERELLTYCTCFHIWTFIFFLFFRLCVYSSLSSVTSVISVFVSWICASPRSQKEAELCSSPTASTQWWPCRYTHTTAPPHIIHSQKLYWATDKQARKLRLWC